MNAEAKMKSPQPAESRTPATTPEIHPIENVYRLFDDFFADRWMREPRFLRGAFPGFGLFGPDQPRVDIVDGDKEVLVTANLPGVDKDDIEVTVTENMLTIRAQKKQEQEESKGEYFRREISHGEISRTLALPAEVNCEQASAAYRDGVLKLTLPKIRTSKRHTVKVQ
ncbi:MAG: Hsp20/alpha crystallin family protein [Methylococcaceae bacterium]|nr:Hsp20/alpha crystallin family protein [Methylococcaceae bacterium]MCI0733073.1 Hsp20/alpha crystallin family protein [Methylococcaceae bacterium]